MGFNFWYLLYSTAFLPALCLYATFYTCNQLLQKNSTDTYRTQTRGDKFKKSINILEKKWQEDTSCFALSWDVSITHCMFCLDRSKNIISIINSINMPYFYMELYPEKFCKHFCILITNLTAKVNISMVGSSYILYFFPVFYFLACGFLAVTKTNRLSMFSLY